MPLYLIEGSKDGDMFAETIEADTMEEAEALAVERLKEAWGEDEAEELSDLGDAALVTEYGPDDYARDAAPELLVALKEMRREYARLHDFISDMIEGGRLTEADIPDDYAAIVDQLENCATADAGAETAIAKATGTHLESEVQMRDVFGAEGAEIFAAINRYNDLARASEGFKCRSCGREEADCSAEPCAAVIADRER